MDEVRLMNRIDTKFVLPVDMLTDLLHSIDSRYMAMVIESRYLFRYRTLYFDTPGLKFYHDHHNGRRPRFKIRFREYSDTGDVFFEVKQKNNKNRTIKKRVTAPNIPDKITEPCLEFMKKYIPDPPADLQPVLWSTFLRITLVNENMRERVTIDTGLGFMDDHRSAGVPHIAVAEIKRATGSGPSFLTKELEARKIFPFNLSKYCTGITLLKEQIKYNRFKEKLLYLKKLEYADQSYPVAG
jgi:hypothetical protein